MKLLRSAALGLLGLAITSHAVPQNVKRDAQFNIGQPIDANGKGAPILGVLRHQQPSRQRQPRQPGPAVDGQWCRPELEVEVLRLQDRILNGGWVREQVIQDLPQSHDIAAAQQHLRKGAIRELHWHKVAEWGIVYTGSVLVSAVDENGRCQAEKLNYGRHLANVLSTTFNIVDWLAHTPRDILAKNFGVDPSVFEKLPATNSYILNGTLASQNVTGGSQEYLSGNSSFVYRALEHPAEVVPGNGEEWLYFHKGEGRATVFIGSGAARTFDLSPGDTAAFPDNSGHYIENTSDTEDLVWIELYKSDRVADVPLTQWLALTPPEIVAQTLKAPIEFVQQLRKERQILI
ncbi:oxalate decarboxylase [Colletotrichum musicola]|uniref:Oxalate decarboxylase n=1 Tax=Colletotrichum musicola TaxID=2175873 RepID=A0A8H6U0H3_9PEZI|nr:oxalate decarboxylase [Colletotrichum musicola]